MGCTASTLPNSGVSAYIVEDYDDFDNRDDIEISHHHDDCKSEVHLQNDIDRRNKIREELVNGGFKIKFDYAFVWESWERID